MPTEEKMNNCHLLWHQMTILFWRSFVTKKRHYIITFFEIFLPCILVLGVVWLFSSIDRDTGSHYNETSEQFNHTIHKRNTPVWDLQEELCFSLDHLSSFSSLYYDKDDVSASPLIEKTRKFLSKIGSSMQLLPSSSPHDEKGNAISFQDLTGLKKKDGSFKYTISGVTYFQQFSFPEPYSHKLVNYENGAFQFLLPLQFLFGQVYSNFRTSKFNISATEMDLSGIKCNELRVLPDIDEDKESDLLKSANKTLMVMIVSVLIISLLVAYCTLCNRLITEKYTGVKEMLIMTGLGNVVYWISTFICYFVYIWLAAFLASIALVIVGPRHVPFLKYLLSNINFPCFSLVVFVHSIQMVLSGMLLSIPFNRPRFGIILAIAYYITPTLLKFNSSLNHPLMYLLTNYGLIGIFEQMASAKMVDLEIVLKGLDWSHLGSFYVSGSSPKTLDIGGIFFYMVASCFLMAFLIWYLDLVWPFQPGVARSFFFLCSPNYWSPKNAGQLEPIKRPASQYFEEEPSANIAIAIRSLTKKYSGRLSGVSHLAVNNIDLNVYHGSITCLLGHNGAGKTTTMNMITGMFMPTKGRIEVNGYDLFTQTRKARSKMSLCPQHNPLSDDFTVKEHLYIYAGLRGVSWSELEKESQDSMRPLGLLEHSDKLANQLSGGMKRKLCLAMALVGGCKIVILDEPSAGLDTESRRAMWDSLKEIRHSRTILMTTHDMEEADALADRIVIMHSGTIVCSGSSMFLKKSLATGYVLKISKAPNFQASNVINLLRQYLARAEVKNDIGSEITYNLNENTQERAQLAECFGNLESNMPQLGIESFGVAASSLEEVFLKIGQTPGLDVEQTDKSENLLRPNIEELIDSDVFRNRLQGFPLFMSQFRGLLVKRLNNFKKNWPLNVFCILIAFLIGYSISDREYGGYERRESFHVVPKIYKGRNYSLQVSDPSVPSNFVDKLNRTIQRHGMAFQASPRVPIFSFDINGKNKGQQKLNYSYQYRYSRQMFINVLFESLSHFNEVSTIETTYQMNVLPFDIRNTTATRDFGSISALSELIGFLISLAFACVTSSYISSPIQERVYKTKLLQLMTGLHPFVFHLASFVFDLAFHVSFSLMFFAFIMIDSQKLFNHFITATLFTSIFFGFACIAFLYLASFIFSTPGKGFTYVLTFQILSSLAFYIVTLMLIAITGGSGGPLEIVKDFIFNLSPFYTFNHALVQIILNGQKATRFGHCSGLNAQAKDDICTRNFKRQHGHINVDFDCCPGSCATSEKERLCASDFEASFFGPNVPFCWLIMLAQFFAYSALLIVIEIYYKKLSFFFSRPKLPLKKFHDEDVQREEQLVQHLIGTSTTKIRPLVASNLYKNFSNFFAVKGISFTVQKNECFGLLGVNGAGKSTTFGILTGDLVATSGKVYQEDLEVTARTREYQANIGYCPQYNPLLETLTGRQMLDLFGRLRGVPKDSLHVLTNEMIRLVNLQQHADKPSGQYSGGNKRKLSIALAMIGNPKLVLLDEPTAGVDPAARRLIWSTLQYIREQFDCSMVLTSHSMDECESLCSRMAIMVSGEFVCLGSAQHLKNRFGLGYTLSVKFRKEQANDDEFFEVFNQALNRSLVKVQLIDRHATIATYQIAKDVGSWAKLFRIIENLASKYNLEDYSLSDTTLEQVFINFAKAQKDTPNDVNETTNESIQLLTKVTSNRVSSSPDV